MSNAFDFSGLKFDVIRELSQSCEDYEKRYTELYSYAVYRKDVQLAACALENAAAYRTLGNGWKAMANDAEEAQKPCPFTILDQSEQGEETKP